MIWNASTLAEVRSYRQETLVTWEMLERANLPIRAELAKNFARKLEREWPVKIDEFDTRIPEMFMPIIVAELIGNPFRDYEGVAPAHVPIGQRALVPTGWSEESRRLIYAW